MRGIIWDAVRRVRLVKPSHPDVVEHQRRQAYRTTLHLDDTGRCNDCGADQGGDAL